MGRSGATVVSVNRDDGGMVYEIEMAEGENIVEVETAGEGEVRETGTDSDGDDLANAREASVSAADAIETALDGRSDRVLDEAELDRHDGRLVWAIDLDDAQGMDAGEVHVDAGTGEVMTS
ncbi:PepSY domain-containing protein [Rothia santali]|uniref:PepSY domain-containing protein n=1 Tax=Rothia santali TaxID=2949643 RepID=UPI0020B28062|nr:PepSY domain-containing protein [Rothia santali]